tara:strand:- start:491 stop:598 length:108 start_codon:yes stop_codon:yes gene_type:complete
MKTEQILKIYIEVTKKTKKSPYTPKRTHYNIHTYG